MDVQDLIRRVSRHFFDLVNDDANPLVVALALQDNSSVGLQYYAEEFNELREELRSSLKERVDANYHGFNESVGVYRHVGGALKSSHEGVLEVSNKLGGVQKLVQAQKESLGELHQKSVALKRRLELMADLEELYAFPTSFEALLVQKRFSEAHSLLTRALELINARDLLRQRRLRPLLSQIRRQQLQLVERLSDETRAQIYLRTPYAARLYAEDNTDYSILDANFESLVAESATRPLDPSGNYFIYLVQLVQNLAEAQGLENILDTLTGSVQDEIKATFKSITAQVASELKIQEKPRPNAKEDAIQQFRGINHAALETLSRTIFAHLLGILQCHSVVSRAASILGFTYSLNAVCAAISTALNQFLLKYVGYDTIPRARANSITQRPDKASAFQFGSNEEDARGLRDFQALREAVRRNVPGLLPVDPNDIYVELQTHEEIEIVVPPHILNMRTLLEPTVKFLASAASVVPEPLRAPFELFLDAFLRKSFVPRLQKVLEADIYAVRGDPSNLKELSDYSTLSKFPLVRCAARFTELVGLAARLLDAGRRAREDFIRIVLHLVHACSEFFMQQISNAFLVSSRQHTLVWNLAIDQRHKLALQQRYAGKPTLKEFDAYFAKRHTPYSAKALINLSDLLEIGVYKQATLLITSLRWFVHWLKKARRPVPNVEPQTAELNDALARWSLLDPGPDSSSSSIASIALSGQFLADYDKIIETLDACIFRALSALRSDIFLRIVYYFDQMITNNDFHKGGRGDKRDPIVDRIQRELSLISQVTDAQLVTADHEFLIGGIAQFMNELFILESDNIVDMDEAGQNQILANIFAFQQMSTSFVSDPREVDFSRATWFYELFRLTPTLIIERARLGETYLGKEDLAMLLQIRHRNAANSTTASLHPLGTLQFHLSQLDEIYDNSSRPISQSSAHSVPTVQGGGGGSNAGLMAGAANNGLGLGNGNGNGANGNGNGNNQSGVQPLQASKQQSMPDPNLDSVNITPRTSTRHAYSKSQGTEPSPRAPPLPNRNSLPANKTRQGSRPASVLSPRSNGQNPPPLPPKSPPTSPRSHGRAPSNPMTIAKGQYNPDGQ